MSTARIIAATVILAGLVAGCVWSSAETPQPKLTARSVTELQHTSPVAIAEETQPSIALVLGGGGLRGFAHVGVLRALEEAGLRPTIVIGTSAGAVVGAAYASGMSSREIETAARTVELLSLIDWTVSSQGLMHGDNLASWIDELTAGVPIERFPVRFAAVATDLDSAEAVLLDSGPAGLAVQASAAVPGINVPVPYDKGHLIDGGVASLVPVRIARAMGADLVFAVDIYCQDIPSSGLGALTVIRRVMHAQNCAIANPEMAAADVLIAPNIRVSGISARDEQELAIKAGYEAARVALADFAGQYFAWESNCY